MAAAVPPDASVRGAASRAEPGAQARPDGGRGWKRTRRLRVGATGRAFTIKGDRNPAWRDAYHNLLTMPWWAFISAVAGVYVATNLLFAALYRLDLAGIGGLRGRGGFVDALNFSVETLGTIGYGAMWPRDGYTNALVAAEAFTSIFLTAVLTGLIFSRVSRPQARILFSRQAVVTTYEGAPTLMFRAANQRANQMLEAQATLTLTYSKLTQEGVRMRVFERLALSRAESQLFALSWTVMHPIDAASPLHGRGDAWLREVEGELVVTLAGTDETSAQRQHARTHYGPDELAWGFDFVDIITPPKGDDPRWLIDYTRFHDIRPSAHPLPRG